MEFQQKNFTGGLNLLDDETDIKDDQYRLLINARGRFANLLPINQSVKLALPFVGNNQGGIAVGNTVILFISGRAYYQIGGAGAWVRIANFSMDATARRFWTQAVSKSTKNYIRQRNGSMNNPIIINTDLNVAGNPAGIVVQDGLTQPWLIQFDATTQTFIARLTKTYSQWANRSVTADDREYVPIGKQMFYINEKLYVVAPDGKSIYQSVTGRPLDFMVNIDVNGNKAASETFGGAATVSFAFDNDAITCVSPVNITDTFIYATARHVRLIVLNYNQTILGEPTYSQAQIIEAGTVNDQSLVNNLGDYAFIDNDGIKSFNAVNNYRVEGKNSIFSANIAGIIDEHIQVAGHAAAIEFENYTLFYCNTQYGKAICVYDTLRQNWVSVDITPIVNIKQFFVFANGDINKLYAVTDQGVYAMYQGATKEMAQLHMKTLMPEDVKAEHKGAAIKPVFRGCTADGTLRVTEYVDEQYSAEQNRTLHESVMATVWPLKFPIGFNSKPNAYNNTITFDKGLVGKKLAYVIQWNTDAALHAVKITTSDCDPDAATRQTSTN